MLKELVIFMFFSFALCKTGSQYYKTSNLQVDVWNALKTELKQGVDSLIVCSAFCNHFHGVKNSCNSFKYNSESKQCQMAQVNELEEFTSNEANPREVIKSDELIGLNKYKAKFISLTTSFSVILGVPCHCQYSHNLSWR